MLVRVGASLLVSAAVFASAAQAGDRVYWANAGGAPSGDISFANLNGSGGGDLRTSGTHSPCCPNGVAIDSARGRIYWGTDDAKGIFFARLDGSGAVGQLNIVPVTPNPVAEGVAIDPAAGRIYWGDNATGKISFARLNGSGGGNLNIAPLTAQHPAGVVIDSSARRIYWADENANEIRFASLSGGGGGTLARAGATVSSPFGLAIDAAAGRVYWANRDVNKISFARLDGSGGDDLTITGTVTVNFPSGVAIDHAAGKIYWANYNGDTISSANLDGSGARNLNTTGTTIAAPNDPALLESPRGAGAPVMSGGSVTGSTLTCSTGSWAADLASAFLFRAPHAFSYKWSRDGATITGATAASLTASAAGAYRCTVSAANVAGSASQTSAAHVVSLPAFGSKTLVTLTLAAKRIPAKGPLKVRVKNGNGFVVTGRLSGKTLNRVSATRKRRIKLRAKAFRIGAHARKTVKLRLPKVLRRVLKRKGKLKLRLTAKVTDPAGNRRTVKKRVTPRLKKKRRR